MKKFIYKSFIFIIIFISLTFLIEKIIFVFIKKVTVSDIGVINKIANGEINSQIIFSGSSRSYTYFNPMIFTEIIGKSSFNIGANSTGLEIQYAKIKFYLKYNTKPEYIIQEISINSLDHITESIYEPYVYLPYLNNKDLFNVMERINKFLFINKYISISNYTYYNTYFQKEMIKNYYYQCIIKKDPLYKGYSAKELKWGKDADDFLKRRKIRYYSINKECIEYLDKVVNFCKNNNIKLILVIPPEYYEIYELYGNKDEIFTFYKKYSIDKKINLLNYSELPEVRDKKYFYNNKHLNKKGSEIFSKICANDLKKIINNWEKNYNQY